MGKGNVAKPSTSQVITSTGPCLGTRSQTKNWPKATVLLMTWDLAEELQAIEQETFDDGHSSEVTHESDLEQEDSENSLTEDEEQ